LIGSGQRALGLDEIFRFELAEQLGVFFIQVPIQIVDGAVDLVIDAGERHIVRRRAFIGDDRGDELARRVRFLLDRGLHPAVNAQSLGVACLIRRALHFGDDHAPHCERSLERVNVDPRQMTVSLDIFVAQLVQEMADFAGHDRR